MSNYLRTRLHFLIVLAGGLVFCFGIFIVASAVTVRNIMGKEGLEDYWDDYPLTCQYWAGIPTILTGGVLVLTVFLNKNNIWKYISFCCVLITMVLTLGVIIEESSSATSIGNTVRSRDSYCNHNSEDTHYPDGRNKFCNKLKKAYPWYYILLFVTDVVLVLCFFVTLLLFADWILFIAPELTRREQMLSVTSGQEQELSVTSSAAPHRSDECHERSCPTPAQEQVWLPLQTR